MDTLFLNSRRKLSQGLLFWLEVGQGTPIIFLHGAWNDSSEWVSVMELLSPHFHCFAPDLLGFGESDFPDSNSMDLQVESLREFLQGLRLARVNLVGHSLGGWVAASYALKYPEKINNLVLLAPLGVETEGLDKQWQKMQRLKNGSFFYTEFWRSLRPVAKALGWDTIELNWRQIDIQEAYPTATELLYQRQLSEIKAELLQDRLDLIVIPALILQGEKDSDDALERSKIYARKLGNAKLKMIAAEDNLPFSNSYDVAGEIRDFLTSKSDWQN